ncbi:MAG: universal stress protein, partial [Thermoproteota archaeon]
MFKRILAAIDGSEQSMNAADVAISLASKYGSELTVLHVVVPFTFNDERNHPGTGLEEEYRRRIQEQTGKWFEGIKRKAGENNVKVKTEWTETSGPVQYEITRYADEQKMEL